MRLVAFTDMAAGKCMVTFSYVDERGNTLWHLPRITIPCNGQDHCTAVAEAFNAGPYGESR